jgi:hypothetical protein
MKHLGVIVGELDTGFGQGHQMGCNEFPSAVHCGQQQI